MRPARRTSGQLVLAWLACVVIGALLASCAAPTPAPDATATPEPTAAIVAKPTAEPASPTPAPSLPKPTARPRPNADPSAYLKLPTLARGYLTTPNELRRIAALAAAKAEPYRAAVKSELAFAADALARPPIDPPKLKSVATPLPRNAREIRPRKPSAIATPILEAKKLRRVWIMGP